LTIDKSGIHAPVYFHLPVDHPEAIGGNPAIVWRLEARAQIPGVDYNEKFEVPVFNTELGPAAQTTPDPLAAHQASLDVGKIPVLRDVQITETLNGVNIHFKPARNPGAIFGLILIIAIWTGIFVVLLKSDAPFIFPVVWAFFDALLIIGLASSLFYGSRIDAADQFLAIHHRLIVPTVTRRFGPGEISDVKAVVGTKSGNTLFYRIQIIPKSGREAVSKKNAMLFGSPKDWPSRRYLKTGHWVYRGCKAANISHSRMQSEIRRARNVTSYRGWIGRARHPWRAAVCRSKPSLSNALANGLNS
jgi:hypothetical protein